MPVKVCGLTRAEDVATALDAGADALGFILCDGPRRLDLEQAKALLATLPPRESRSALAFAVVRDPSPEQARELARAGFDGLQLQGSESPEAVAAIRRAAPDLVVWKSLAVRAEEDLERIGAYDVDALHLDAWSPLGGGGTGRQVPIDLSRLRQRIAGRRVVLAGGLTPENVSEAIRAARPWGVDVSSGVESASGHKDAERVRAFLAAARTALGGPDARGRFGDYGGRFVPETLVTPLEELESAWRSASADPAFAAELERELRLFAGRPTPLYRADRLAETLGDFTLYLKREDLLHTGAHKINNTIGQCLLTKRMGKKRVVAETGAGQHGVATAAAAAHFGLACTVYMGEEDMRRQRLNVERMRLLGAEVRGVAAGQRTLKDAINEAMRDWVTRVRDTHYVLGSVLGPHPFPAMVRDFHSVIGRETRAQIEALHPGRRPDWLIACVGGGSNAIGLFHEFVGEPGVRLVGVEAGGLGIETGRHAARFADPALGVLHGTQTLVLQDGAGQIRATHSVSAGLDYPALGPEHAWLAERKLARYDFATDKEAIEAFEELSRTEGILPALESAHAFAWLRRHRDEIARGAIVVVNLSGRGDKDVDEVLRVRGEARDAR